MKKISFSIIGISAVLFIACNSGSEKNNHEGHDLKKDTVQHTIASDNKELKVVSVIYTNVDAKAAASIKEIVEHYLHMKNALVSDNGSEAAAGAKAMDEAIRKLDKSFLSAEQKKVYDEIAEDLKEHAEHIGKNGDNLQHQRAYFSMLSEDVYDLAKTFGGGKALYHDHCPMYNEDKGGVMWLSETKDIKNPYFGREMLKCGSVEEVIK